MKALSKTALCALYKYSGALRLQEAVATMRGQSSMAILLFHRVADNIPEDGLTVSTRRFRRICAMLRRCFRVVSLGEVFRIHRSGEANGHRAVAITFDDCYRNNFEAAHVLAEYGLPATFFVPTSFVGTDRAFTWDRDLPAMPNLSWDDLRAMSRLGFEIGSHTMTHVDLGVVSSEQARREMIGSKAIIEEQLDRPVKWFAYPFGGPGNFRPEMLPLLDRAGYEGCVSGFGGLVSPSWKQCVLPREPVPYFRSNLNLELHLSGCLNWFYALKRRLGWMDNPAGRLPEQEISLVLTSQQRLCQGY
jgi:peptidoglycan/xylan/chitin deacetylase (PgdA/CDA1 family)